MRRGRLASCLLFSIGTAPLVAQTPEEHARHHPPPAAPVKSDSGPRAMGPAMRDMMAPPPHDVYPTLMNLPSLTSEQRARLTRDADERVMTGTRMMNAGFEGLAVASRGDTVAAMQEALEQVRAGLARFESGLAIRQALDAGRSAGPRGVALTWLRSEMNLAPSDAEVHAGFRALAPFHLFVMLALFAFAGTMIWIYFRKMRQIEKLVGVTGRDAVVPPAQPAPPDGR